MFSGIVEEAATIAAVEPRGGNVDLVVRSAMARELRVDQSVAHNGVCLTVVEVGGRGGDGTYRVTAVQETLYRSNLGLLRPGSLVNLERSMVMGGRLDGHIVQGHVDCTAVCRKVDELDGSRRYTFQYDVPRSMAGQGYCTVEKGSVAVNGVSLTVCDSQPDSFAVAIIPYTLDHTNFREIKEGTRVNIEFDILGKYLARISQLSKDQD